MASPKSMNLEQLKAYKKELEKSGRQGGKEYGKVINLIKTMEPHKYGDEAVADAYTSLSSGVTTPGGWTDQHAEDIYKWTGKYPDISGTSGGIPMSGSTGPIDLSSIYDQYFNTPEIQAKKEEASQKETERDEAIGSIQNNPWYSQATRGGKIAAVKTDAERNLERINNELTRLQTDAQIQYNIKLQQYDINRQAYQDSLNLFNSLVSSGALENASGSDISKLSVQTGIPTSMINSIVQTSKMKNLTLQSYDDGTGQYVISLDGAGNIVNKTYLGPSKSSASASADPFKYLDPLSVNSASSAYKGALQSPQYPAKPGTVVEYPQGSGVYWEAGNDGSWY